MNDNNREYFGKRVFLDEKLHPNQNYLRSSFGFIYETHDKKSMLPLNRDISDIELKGLLALDKKRSGSIGHTRIETKPQNAVLTQKDLDAVHKQKGVPTGIRRFQEQSEGDSIFNSDTDVIRGRINAYKLKKERQSSDVGAIDFDNPVDRIKKFNQLDHLRMTQ